MLVVGSGRARGGGAPPSPANAGRPLGDGNNSKYSSAQTAHASANSRLRVKHGPEGGADAATIRADNQQ